ncbi:hypothetical protein [Nocardioides bruguierae]|uniref:Uncharacterized protein n=1 Tax=Nocardioides bruguierae TaxID=2945102 RepID=A0A9X2D9F9_9ACTN|nr:hypothetical protein [Nocardioides bruguierae]MCM0621776.1 hypothetical protein [Nocardioides bruguierae]
MTLIQTSDPDFRICELDFETLIELQQEAEERGWGTRWTSAEALRGQVSHDEVALLQPFLRQRRGRDLHVFRCFILFSSLGSDQRGAITTMDVAAERVGGMRRVDRDPDVRNALSLVFKLASSGIGMVPKA